MNTNYREMLNYFFTVWQVEVTDCNDLTLKQRDFVLDLDPLIP